ncbi:50S ribosomal protein L18 [Candidatus Woesearchaeota archaeon]|nr:50S ribosomal protein L18 [Candidatus Woesearchaeota archaeon]
MKKTTSVPYRRKREGRTDYKKRMKLLLGSKPRLTVRKSLKHIVLQLIEFQPNGDKIIISASSKELQKKGWKGSTGNTSAAYLTGLLLAKKAKKKIECVLDLGQYTSVKGTILYAAAKGAKDGGMTISISDEVIPDEKRIRGEHIANYAKKLKENKEKYEKQFSKYLKQNFDPETLPQHFDTIKKAIGGQ